MASSTNRRISEQQHVFTRQANILRKNLSEWDRMLRTPRGEDWPTMLGRLSAALNQAGTLDRSIDDVLEHFVHLPLKSPMNPQDIPFFLSTRMADETEILSSSQQPRRKKRKMNPQGNSSSSNDQDNDTGKNGNGNEEDEDVLEKANVDPIALLQEYENRAARIAQEYEEQMVRF